MNDTRDFGGGSYFIYKLAETLSFNNEVFLFTNTSYLYSNEGVKNNLRIFPHKINFQRYNRLTNMIKNNTDIIQNIWLIDDIFNSSKPDVVVGYQMASAQQALKVSKKYNIHCVNFVYEYPEIFNERRKNLGKFGQINKNVMKIPHNSVSKRWDNFKNILLESSGVIGISNYIQQGVEKWLSREIMGFVYPGVDIVKPANSKKSSDHISYLGRLSPEKNIEQLMIALSILKNPPKLKIYGEGKQEKYLKMLSKKLELDCTFEGRISEAKKFNVIEESKFMVFPTDTAGFAMPPLEALMCNKACIVPDIEIMREISSENFVFYESGNVADLALKISSLDCNKSIRDKVSNNGNSYVSDRFSWGKSASNFENIINQLI